MKFCYFFAELQRLVVLVDSVKLGLSNQADPFLKVSCADRTELLPKVYVELDTVISEKLVQPTKQYLGKYDRIG